MSTISAKTRQIRDLYKDHLWQGRLVLAVLITFLVLAAVRIALPYIIIYSTVYWLDSQGVSSQIDDIFIDIDQGTFTVINAAGSSNGNRVFDIGKASIDWEWRPLSKKTIHIKSVTLEDFKLQAIQYTDALSIAGIIIKDDGTIEQQDTNDDQSIAWGASLNQIDLKQLGFCFQQFDAPIETAKDENKQLDYCGDVGLARWQGNFNLGREDSQQVSTDLKLTLDGTLSISQLSLLNNRLDATLVSIGDTTLANIVINGINDIKLDGISVEQLALLQGSGHTRHEHAVQFDKLDISGLSVSNTDTVDIRSIALIKPVVSMSRNETGVWKYEQWLPQTKTAPTVTKQQPVKQKTTVQPADTAFNIKLGNISIIDLETCYQQPAIKTGDTAPALDYCLRLADSDWQGNIAISIPATDKPLALSVNGDFVLTRFQATNNLLNRDLLAFDKLAINKITLNNLEDIAFNKLELDNASGLELTSQEDKHTVSISSLDISTFSYRKDTLAIDKVAVNDLGLELTQNKDGSLDIDKWRPATDAQQTVDKTEPKPTTAEPLKIRLGEFILKTKRSVEFTDLTVTPNMVIGLEEIQLNVKDLDSEKPKQKSPIELSAKTSRHATIRISGVAMPFDSKPSFDATGKIAGLDLRVASPKAEQTIGHTIKSGQMDADLKLMSDQGQLDSEISLVLHHFNLKAKSKEDAAALDEMFGMPINQSLMLLKDKSGKIKLDIPITGDINNPDFNPTDAIIKATTKATTVTLITFYTPYGLAFAGGNVLFNLATALNFDPLIFEPGSSQLSDAHKQQLAKLSELLTERPQIHLTLCGLTNLDDRSKLFTEIINKEKITPVSAERLEKLKQLANERQDRVKDYLVSTGKIAHDRLILCEPEHNDDTKATAGVEISI